MISPPHLEQSLEDEQHRAVELAALALNSTRAPERERALLDRLAALARRHLRADAATVSIVGRDQVRTLGSAGVDLVPEAWQISLADRVIRGPGVTIIDDAAEERPAAGSGIRSCAGAPITTARGARIGAVCVWHGQPCSRIDADDCACLGDFAEMAMDILELRRPANPTDQPALPAEPDTDANRAMLESLAICCVVFDRRRRIRLASPAFAVLIGRPDHALIGLSLDSLVQSGLDRDQLRALANHQGASTGIWQLRTRGRRLQEMECELSLDTGREPLFVARLRHHRGRTMTRQPGPYTLRILDQLVQNGDPEAVVVDLLDASCRELSGHNAIASLVSGPERRVVIGLPGQEAFCEALQRHHRFIAAHSICATTCATGHSTISPNTREEERWPNYAWLDLAYGIRAVWSVPIPSNGDGAAGALTLFRDVSGAPTPAQMAILREAAAMAALAVRELDVPALAQRTGSNTWSVNRLMRDFRQLPDYLGTSHRLGVHAIQITQEQHDLGLSGDWARQQGRDVLGGACILVTLDDSRILVVAGTGSPDDLTAQHQALCRQLQIDAVGDGRSRRVQSRVASLPVESDTDVTALLSALAKSLTAQGTDA